MSRLTGFAPSVRRLIKLRAGLDETGETIWVRCEGCGDWFTDGWFDVHHRMGRGSGGTKRPFVNQAANGMVLCRPEHHWAETHPEKAEEKGWRLSKNRNGLLPSSVPVECWDGTFTFTDDGLRIPQEAA